MKKAVIYARVSSEEQKKRQTIDSQIAALRRQVAESGNVLIKEYIDDGYTGATLDRPGLNALREDIKSEVFDVVYFWAADRIARDASYHTIIVGEILGADKQVIINGQDYKENPENKFKLRVIGAMAELERAKIIERYKRGKMHKLRKGYLVGCGIANYGYTYVKKTDKTPAALVINDKEAEVVRWIFESYASGASKSKIIRYLEDNRIPTKTGLLYWEWTTLEGILKNSSYIGIKYFNTRTMVKKSADPIRKVKYGKEVFRDESEWLPVKVPAIISKELFEKAQRRLKEYKQKYMNPQVSQLLSNLVKCGECGASCTSYKRFVRGYYLKKQTGGLYHRTAYVCSRTIHQHTHSKKTDMKRCDNAQVSAPRLEAGAFAIVKEIMASEEKLKQYIFGQRGEHATKVQTERQLKDIEHRIADLTKTKREALELYAKGKIDRATYTLQCKQSDDDIKSARGERDRLLATIPTLHKKSIVDASIEHYCGALKTRLATATDFDSQRNLFLDYIEQVTFVRDRMELHGVVPILLNAYADPDQTSEAKEMRFVVGCVMPPKYRTVVSSRKRERVSDSLRIEIDSPKLMHIQ